MAKLIAVDLGSHRVKLAIYEGGFGRYQLEQLLSARVEQDDEEAPQLGARVAALASLLEEIPAQARPTFAATWPAERASLRHVSLPFAEKAQIDKVLPFEVEGLVPFDMEQVELRHRILRMEPGDSQVLAAMVERQPLVDWLAALHDVGADPRSVMIDADVLSELATNGVQAIVDIGHGRTVVTLCEDGQVIAARALDIGGRDLTQALCEAQGLSWSEAEDRKHTADIGSARDLEASPAAVEWEGEEDTQPGATPPSPPRPLTGGDDATILRRAVMPLLAELRSTLISFEDGQAVEVGEVLLIGGTSHLGGLRNMLAATFGVPVRMVPPGGSAAGHPDPGAWALVHALGTRAARGKTSSMELRQGGLAFKGDLYLVRQVGLYGGVFAACALLAGTAMFVVRAVQLDRQLGELDQQVAQAVVDTFDDVTLAQVDTSSKALAIMTEKTMEVTSRVDALGAIVNDEPPTVSLLRDLSEALPSHSDARIDVDDMTVTTSTITIEAETDGYEQVSKIESSLQATSRFKRAKKSDESKNRSGGITFKLTIPRDTEADLGEEG